MSINANKSPASGHFFEIEHNFFFAGQFLLHFMTDQCQVAGIGHIIKVIGGHREHRAQAEIGDPFFVELVELPQVLAGDLALEVASAMGYARGEGGDRSP